MLNPNGDIANITLSYPVKADSYLHVINGNYEVNDFIVVGATEQQNITVKLSKTVNQNIQINVFYIPSYN